MVMRSFLQFALSLCCVIALLESSAAMQGHDSDAAGGEGDSSTATPSHLWIGVICHPVPELTRTHLRIPGGLVVLAVAANSPAERAGLQINDLILKINGQRITCCQALDTAVQASDGESIRLLAVRDGEPLEFSVHPEIRPPCQKCLSVILSGNDADDPDKIQQFQLHLQTNPTTGEQEIVVIGPGIVIDNPNDDSDRPLQSTNEQPKPFSLSDMEKRSIQIGDDANSTDIDAKQVRDALIQAIDAEKQHLANLEQQFGKAIGSNPKSIHDDLHKLQHDIYDAYQRIECLNAFLDCLDHPAGDNAPETPSTEENHLRTRHSRTRKTDNRYFEYLRVVSCSCSTEPSVYAASNGTGEQARRGLRMQYGRPMSSSPAIHACGSRSPCCASIARHS